MTELGKAGRVTEALALADEVAQTPESKPGHYYDAGAALAWLAGQKENAGASRERYQTRAVEMLRLAWKAGFFKNPKVQESLRTHPDFDNLRSRADFQALLAEVLPQSGSRGGS